MARAHLIPAVTLSTWRNFLLALLIGGAGAAAAVAVNMPLAWLLGAAVACAAAAMLDLPVTVPAPVRPPIIAIVGVMLGGGFSARTLGSMVDWLPTMAGLLVFLAAGAGVTALFFRKAGRMDLATAYFAGMPGGIVEMAMIGEQQGGELRTIILAHASRVLITVMALPWIILLLGGGAIGARPAAGTLNNIFDPGQIAILIAIAVGGSLSGRLARLPTPDLVGPMLLSGLFHMAGWVTFNPPFAMIAAAQVVLGANIGCRFANTSPAFVSRMLLLSSGATGLLLCVTVACAFVVHALTGQPLVPIVLAYAPGGLTEMSIVALSLHVEIAFVVTHHIARIFLVLAASGPIFSRLRRHG